MTGMTTFISVCKFVSTNERYLFRPRKRGSIQVCGLPSSISVPTRSCAHTEWQLAATTRSLTPRFHVHAKFAGTACRHSFPRMRKRSHRESYPLHRMRHTSERVRSAEYFLALCQLGSAVYKPILWEMVHISYTARRF